MTFEDFLNRRHVPVFLLLTCFYLVIETVYVVRMPLGHDEFQGASVVATLLDQTPYQDFQPYKTVLGYYVQLLALLPAPTPWSGLLFIRAQQALLTAATLLFAAFWLRRFYKPASICLALALLVTMSTFLERSAELRVDMLTSIFGFLSLLLLLDKRPLASGLLVGASLLISQKGGLFVLAGGFALGISLLAQKDRASLRSLVVFAVASSVPLLCYLAFWSAIASPMDVFQATFRQPTQLKIAFVSYPETEYVYPTFWSQTIRRNPFFYGLALWSLVSLLRTTDTNRPFSRRRILFNYSAALFLLMLWVKQPWPYFFVLLIPTLFLLHVEFFERELTGRKSRRWLAVAYVVLGLALPLSRFNVTFHRDNGFQKHMFELADAALEPGESYLAGCRYLYHRPQHTRRLSYISEYTANPVHRMSAEQIAATITSLEEERLKLLIHAHTFGSLPNPLKVFLRSGFARLWGNIFMYAPLVNPEETHFELEFDGHYLLANTVGSDIDIDGVAVPTGSLVQLSSGRHDVRTDSPMRFKLIPPGLRQLALAEYRDLRDLYAETSEY